MIRPLCVAFALCALASCSGRREEQPVTRTTAMAGPMVPPVDRDTPARLETATFAVG